MNTVGLPQTDADRGLNSTCHVFYSSGATAKLLSEKLRREPPVAPPHASCRRNDCRSDAANLGAP